MRRLLPALRWWSAAAIALLVVAGCGNSGSDTGSTAAAQGGSSTSSASSTSNVVKTMSTSLGTILTDGHGMTLYSFAPDTKGTSNCLGTCLTYWRPVTPKSAPHAAAGVTAKIGTIQRDAGTKQLTINGYPMYTYVSDQAPGDTQGQGTNLNGGFWWVVKPDGTWLTGAASSSDSSGGGSSSYVRGGGY